MTTDNVHGQGAVPPPSASPLPPPQQATDADVEAAREDAQARTEVARQKLADAQRATGDQAQELQAKARAKYLERPELFVGGALVGGLLLARILKVLGRE